METCTVNLYQCEIVPARNCYVEGLSTYLFLNGAKKTYTNFQHQRIALDISITVPIDVKDDDEAVYNYCSISQEGMTFYFFVNSPIRRNGYTSLTLSLSMDTVSTFWDNFDWSWKTNIVREHRPRYVNQGGSATGTLRRLIDYRNEGLNPVKPILASNVVVGSESEKWYLVYASSEDITPDNTTDPVRTLILSNTSMLLKPAISGGSAYTISVGNIANFGVFFCTAESLGLNGTITFYTRSGVSPSSVTYNLGTDVKDSNKILRAVRFYAVSNSTVYVRKLYYTGDSYPYSYADYEDETILTDSSCNIEIVNGRGYTYSALDTTYYRNLQNLETINNLTFINVNAGTVPALYSSTFANLDRSNSRFSKIVELPYRPTNSFTGFNIDYGYKTYSATLNDTTMVYEIDDVGSYLADTFYHTWNPSASDTFLASHESKIHASEFESYYFRYDSYQYNIKAENVTITGVAPKLNVFFYTSNDMSGNKMFYITPSGATINYDTDFENAIIATRNTEKPIYNSGYADYLKTGYNYDQEANKRQNTLTAISSVIGGLSGATSLAGGAAGMAAEGGGSLGVSFATSLISSGINQVSNIISSVNSIECNKLSFAHSLNEKLAGSVSVNGQASTDLMDIYGGGKLRMITRKMRDDDIENVARMFHLIGYSYNKREIPDFTSRYWWNYVQCDPVFNDQETAVYKEYLDDIRARFKAGVTVFHVHNHNYNFNQTLENWETFLIS